MLQHHPSVFCVAALYSLRVCELSGLAMYSVYNLKLPERCCVRHVCAQPSALHALCILSDSVSTGGA